MKEGVQTVRETSRPAWLHSIDAARGLAALMVMFFHAQRMPRGPVAAKFWEGEYVGLFGPEGVLGSLLYCVFGLGFLGVPLFFVISGFCIHLPFAGSRGRLELASFGRRRWLRIFPAYAVTCVVGFIILAVRVPYGEEGLTLVNMFGHIFFWHYSLPVESHSLQVSIVLWTIVIEVHFYLLYSLLFPWLRRIGIGRSTLIALAIGIAYRIYWAQADLADQDVLRLILPTRFALARFGEWLLGAWLAERYVRGGSIFPEWAVFASGSRTFAFGLGCAGIAIVSVILTEASLYWLQIPVTIGFTIALGGLIMSEQQSSRASGQEAAGRLRAVTKWLGDRSYSLYLSHFITLHVVYSIGQRVAARVGLSYEPMSPIVLSVTAVAIVSCLVVAHGLYVLVEAPSHRLARKARVVPPKPTPRTS
ncbi:MAG: acyltransferase [Deltaproteobacteria bacterium]|nr:acyltransferase [Deltaproteobacteria bacterium]